MGTVQGFINKLAKFNGTYWAEVQIHASDIIGRELILVIPPNASQAQLQALNQIQQSALNRGVNLIIQIMH